MVPWKSLIMSGLVGTALSQPSVKGVLSGNDRWAQTHPGPGNMSLNPANFDGFDNRTRVAPQGPVPWTMNLIK